GGNLPDVQARTSGYFSRRRSRIDERGAPHLRNAQASGREAIAQDVRDVEALSLSRRVVPLAESRFVRSGFSRTYFGQSRFAGCGVPSSEYTTRKPMLYA